MATTTHAIASSAETAPRTRDRRATVFRAVAGLVAVGLLLGGMILLFMLAPWTLLGPHPDGYTAEIHRWHHADVGALFGFLVAGSLLVAIPAPRQRAALVQAAIVALGAMLAVTLLDEVSIGSLAIPAIVTGLLVAAYPAPRALASLRVDTVSVPLLGLTALTAVPLLRNAWDNLRLQASDHSQHADRPAGRDAPAWLAPAGDAPRRDLPLPGRGGPHHPGPRRLLGRDRWRAGPRRRRRLRRACLARRSRLQPWLSRAPVTRASARRACASTAGRPVAASPSSR